MVNSGISFTVGNQIVITYLTGLDETSPGAGYTNGAGYTFDEWDSTDPNGAPGDFIPSTPIYLQEVVGTFTDGSGDIVGSPFAVGNGTTVTVPGGALALQLGINDNYYYDNSDAPENPLQFSVSDLQWHHPNARTSYFRARWWGIAGYRVSPIEASCVVSKRN